MNNTGCTQLDSNFIKLINMDEIILSEKYRWTFVIEKKEDTIYSLQTQDIEDLGLEDKTKPEEDGNVKWLKKRKIQGSPFNTVTLRFFLPL